jgi:hypothetical protein
MYYSFLVTVALVVSGPEEPPFPLRTDASPKEWKADEINDGLPYRWEKGVVHILAWEVIEDDRATGRSQITHALILKRFDHPVEKEGYRWVMANLYHHAKDKRRPWQSDRLRLRPLLPGQQRPKLTDAQVFGHELYRELPTDKQVEAFLREARWRPTLGVHQAFTISDGKVVSINYTKKLTAGGLDRTLWKELFRRDVPTKLFPELKKTVEDKK